MAMHTAFHVSFDMPPPIIQIWRDIYAFDILLALPIPMNLMPHWNTITPRPRSRRRSFAQFIEAKTWDALHFRYGFLATFFCISLFKAAAQVIAADIFTYFSYLVSRRRSPSCMRRQHFCKMTHITILAGTPPARRLHDALWYRPMWLLALLSMISAEMIFIFIYFIFSFER